MTQDFKRLDLPQLARQYQQEFKHALAEELALAQDIAQRAWQRKLCNAQQRLQQYDTESGSDGVLEAALEVVGDFDPQIVQVDRDKIKESVRAPLVSAWIAEHQIAQKLSWLPHQMMAYFATWTPVRRGEVYSPALTYQRAVVEGQDLFALGASLLAKAPRGEFFRGAPKGSQQYKSPINSLVPIVLAGFKRYHNIPYMAWDLTEIAAFENAEIAKLVGTKLPDLTQSELIALRNTALTAKSGPRAGRTDNPATSANLYHLQDTALGHLPKFAKYMALQTWCAHPQNRDPYAILDPENWDRVPEPLLTGVDIFVPKTSNVAPATQVYQTAEATPWD